MILEKLKKFPSDLILLIAAAIGVVILLTINMMIFEPLTAKVPFYGILDFEFAWTKERILTIFSQWGDPGMAFHAEGVYWDFLYILGYGAFIAGLILIISRKLSGKIQLIGLYLTFSPFLAGLFDCIENILLLTMLNNPSGFSTVIPLIAGIMATIKFSLLIIGIGFFLLGVFVWLATLIKSRK